MNNFISIQNAKRVFATRKGRFHALREINLSVAQGEFVMLIGHSGCGKSTLLNLIAGLTLPSSGVLLCDKRDINAPGPERAVVFQNRSLLHWLTCFENVHLAVERVFAATEGKAQVKARTERLRVFRSCPLTTPKRTHSSLQMLAIARAMAVLCA